MASMSTSMPVAALNSGSRSWMYFVSGTVSMRMWTVWACTPVVAASTKPAASNSLFICVTSLLCISLPHTRRRRSLECAQRQSLDQIAAHERQQRQHRQERDARAGLGEGVLGAQL